MKERIIYYNADGTVDRVATYINNNEWTLPVFVLVMVMLTGIVESL